MIRKEMFFGKPEKIHEFMETRGKKYQYLEEMKDLYEKES
jgi:hypothetical protein